MKKLPSPNFDQRQLDIDMLVIHYTGRPSLKESLAWLTDQGKKVSAHYLIDEKGEIYHLVEEKNRAWHAGISFWKGVSDINSCSIGVELQNPGHEFGYRDFPEKQIAALVELSREIIARRGIPAHRVLGHSDVAPTRKQDPGEKFPWRFLAEKGIGLWPKISGSKTGEGDIALFVAGLGELGYAIKDKSAWEKTVLAFQRHWHPDNLTGKPDAESFARLISLLEQAG